MGSGGVLSSGGVREVSELAVGGCGFVSREVARYFIWLSAGEV